MGLNSANRTLALSSTTNLAYFVVLMRYVYSKAYFGVFLQINHKFIQMGEVGIGIYNITVPTEVQHVKKL